MGDVFVEGVWTCDVAARAVSWGVRGQLAFLEDQLQQREHRVAEKGILKIGLTALGKQVEHEVESHLGCSSVVSQRTGN